MSNRVDQLTDALIERLEKALGEPSQQHIIPVRGLNGWTQDQNTGDLQHDSYGTISIRRGGDRFRIFKDNKFYAECASKDIAAKIVYSIALEMAAAPEMPPLKAESDSNGGVTSVINVLKQDMAKSSSVDTAHLKQKTSIKQTPSKNIKDSVRKEEDELDEVEKSNYGPKGMSQYNAIDNIRRKARNTDRVMDGPNANAKSYSSKPGQLSAKAQAALEARKQKTLSGPVRQWSMEEIRAENERRKLAKAQLEEDKYAQQLANKVNSMIFKNYAAHQPTDEEMFGHLIPTKDQLSKAEESYNNVFNSFFTEVSKPISARFKSEEEELAYWNSIKINSNGGESGY